MPDNEVEYKIRAKDESAAAVKAARENLRRLREEKKLLETQVKATTYQFNQFGMVAANLGQGQLGALINQVEALTVGKMKLAEAAKTAKATLVALGAASVAAGYSIGDSIRKYIPWFNEPDKLGKAASTLQKIQQVSAQRLGVRDPAAGSLAGQRADTAGQIAGLQRFGAFGRKIEMTEEENELAFQLQQLQNEREVKAEEDKAIAIKKIINDARIEAFTLDNEFAGRQFAEVQKFNDAMDELERSKLMTEEEKLTVYEDAYRAHQLKIANIHMAAQDKIVAQEKATRQRQLNTFANYTGAVGSLMGSLSTLAGALGKKQFGLSQALRYGEAIMNTAAGVARAFADYAWPYSMVVAATVGAAGAAQIATIAAQKPPQAHSGLDYVPEDATYKLKKGEMVLDPGTSDEVRENASNRWGGGGDIILDGIKITRWIYEMSRNGQLKISSRALVA